MVDSVFAGALAVHANPAAAVAPPGGGVPRIGDIAIPPDAAVAWFPLPVWEGAGVTRIQYFIDDERVCVLGQECVHGDDRGFADGQEITDDELPARVRIVLDHEAGVGTAIAYPTHGEDGDTAALPIELTVDPGTVEMPEKYPSQMRVYTWGEGIDGNIVFDYRFLNSRVPEIAGGLAPAINGAVRLRRGAGGTLEIDGRLAQYPSVEIIRDTQLENGYRSALIFTKAQESGGPINLYEPAEEFRANG
jgi:hypothetical protein